MHVEHVEQRPVLAGDEPGALVAMSGRRRPAARARSQSFVRLLGAGQMPLQLDVDVEAAVDGHQALEEIARGISVTLGQARRHRPPAPPVRQTSPAACSTRSSKVAAPSPLGARILTRVKSRQRFLYPSRSSTRRREPTADVERHLGADDGLEAEPRTRAVELRRAVEAVGVDERHGGLIELRRPLGQGLRQRASPRES